MQNINFPELIIGFLLGIFGTIATEWLRNVSAKNKQRKNFANLEGLWVERVDGQEDRRFSIAEFSYDKSTKTYHYNGKNYNNDSSHFYRWRTEKLFKDPDENRILYIYSVYEEGSSFESREGFGVTFFDTEGKKSKFTHGYFLDANLDTAIRNVKFVRIQELARKLYFDLGDASDSILKLFIVRLIEFENSHKTAAF